MVPKDLREPSFMKFSIMNEKIHQNSLKKKHKYPSLKNPWKARFKKSMKIRPENKNSPSHLGIWRTYHDNLVPRKP